MFTKFTYTHKQIEKFHEAACRDWQIARSSDTSEVAFRFCYDALVKLAVALCAANGLKAKSRPGHHIALVKKMAQFLGDKKIEGVVDNMRVKRNADLYDGGRIFSRKEADDLTRDEISQKDAEFKSHKRKEVLKKAGKTLAYGIAFGAIFNEAFAFAKDNHEGLIEGMVKGHIDKTSEHINFTPLEYLRRYIAGEFPRMDGSSIHTSLINGGEIKLPAGVDLVPNNIGSSDLMQSGEVYCPGLEIDANGKLTDASKVLLADKGAIVSESVKHIEQMVPGKTTVKDFIDNHDEIFTKIKRTLWYDNDTPKPVFDKNELGTDWGGENGSGVDKEGNFVMNIKRMVSSGSYHNNFSVDATKGMSEGKLKLLLTVSQGTQDQVIPVDVDAAGNIVIDKSSEAGKLLFGVDENDHAVFKGRFAEAAEMMGEKDGVEQVRILSTVVGKGINFPEGAKSIVDNIPAVIDTPETIVNIPEENIPAVIDTPETIVNIPGDHGVDMPFFVPVTGRRPMEKAMIDEDMPPYYFDHEPISQSREKMYELLRSQTLKNDPKAKLDHYQEIETYIGKFSEEYKKIFLYLPSKPVKWIMLTSSLFAFLWQDTRKRKIYTSL